MQKVSKSERAQMPETKSDENHWVLLYLRPTSDENHWFLLHLRNKSDQHQRVFIQLSSKSDENHRVFCHLRKKEPFRLSFGVVGVTKYAKGVQKWAGADARHTGDLGGGSPDAGLTGP